MNKTKHLLLLSVVVASVFVNLLTPVIASASARPTDKDVKAFLFSRSLQYCFANEATTSKQFFPPARDRISAEDADSGNWFKGESDTYKPVSYNGAPGTGRGSAGANSGRFDYSFDLYPYGNTERASCSDSAWIQDAVSTLGYSSGSQALVSLGLTAEDDNRFLVVRGTDMDTLARNVPNRIKDGPYGKTPAISNNQTMYQLYYPLLMASDVCGATDVPEGGTARDAMIKIAQTDGVVQKPVEFSGAKADERIPVYSSTGDPFTASCLDIAAWVTSSADGYSVWAKENNVSLLTPDTANSATSTAGQSTCNVDGGLGWIICPTIRFMANIFNGLLGMLTDFLAVDPSIASSDMTRVAWSTFRDFANVAFVFVFLFIVYSQITSAGISNYGIKRMLPRLIVSAILVNLSLVLCQLAVDLSNMAGYGLKSLFEGILGSQDIQGALVDSLEGGDRDLIVGTILTLGLVATGIGAAAVALLSISAGVILFGVLALLMTVLLLMGRQAGIVILIVIAPLAFVAFLLPNTEKLFKRWLKIFTTLLILFPVVALVFHASSLASKIFLTSATQADNEFLQITAIAIQVIPLFVIPTLLKGSLNAFGSVGQKLGGMAGGFGKRASSAAQKKANLRYQRSSFAQGRAMRESAKDAYRRRRLAENIRSDNVRGKFASIGGFAITKSGKFAQEQLQRSAVAQADKDFETDVSAAATTQKGVSFDEIKSIANGTVGSRAIIKGKETVLSEADIVAAKRDVFRRGNFDDKIEAILSTANQSGDDMQRIRTAASEGFYSSGMQGIFGAPLGGSIESTGVDSATLNGAVIKNIKDKKVKPEAAVDASAARTLSEALSRGLASGELSIDQAKELKESVVDKIRLDTELNAKSTQLTDTYLDEIAGQYSSLLGKTSSASNLQGGAATPGAVFSVPRGSSPPPTPSTSPSTPTTPPASSPPTTPPPASPPPPTRRGWRRPKNRPGT
jgi:hypothetical protein